MKHSGAVQRPPLPLQHANPHLNQMDPSKPPPVKFQEIVRDGLATIVGRLKIQTPSGHAFILRRLDTGAVSLTTMFRAAFPNASDDSEKLEANWVRASFDLSGTNKGGRSRFAGTWVTPDIAVQLAEDYNLSGVIPVLARAEPDPTVVYRRSTRAQQPTPEQSPAAGKEPGPAPAKKRREASPATPASKHTPASVPTPVAAPAAVAPTVPTPPPSTTRQTETPSRRSTRHKSPAPPPSAPLPTRTPRSARSTRKTTATPAAIKEELSYEVTETIVDPVAQKLADEVMEEDIREQKALIARLKAGREEQRVRRAAEPEEEDEEESEPESGAEQQEVSPAKPASKRPRDDGELKFDFKEPSGEVGERAIATNRRVSMLANIPPERKSLAWGALAFAVGWGAINFLPTVQNYLSI
ncbi:uncharacterized protein C8Q71DRAFT_795791 [Rhodofomes roseus]|uniref:HTH APSES-type domain-containing protein n=1 Tax=Rhodofomes roseus TaxID=34475 RepID=A0ABQ8KK04_9APHY|nr:uncharacterized protein C8Q71DRAFT_795791 [Rhodofomes roseus]KAH9838258.1 hypothetical protein C8Q71DRAFT_795791 [Rhodofomes roseus]